MDFGPTGPEDKGHFVEPLMSCDGQCELDKVEGSHESNCIFDVAIDKSTLYFAKTENAQVEVR